MEKMSDNCNQDCSQCMEDCQDRQEEAFDFTEELHELSQVKKVIAVMSGKGGVGKSLVTALLAKAMQERGYKTAIMDADITGSSIPKMLGLEGQVPAVIGNALQPIQVTGTLSVMSMAFLLSNPSDPIIWRGPMKIGAIRQLLTEVNWGSLDYLVVDLPPGTGDEALTIGQAAPNIRGAVIVTTPQEVAVLDATKAIRFIEKQGMPVIGVIENMSGMVCPHCGEVVDLFGRGGGEAAAAEFGVPYLGAIPLDPEMMKAGDEGRPFILRHSDSPTWKAIDTVMENLVNRVES